MKKLVLCLVLCFLVVSVYAEASDKPYLKAVDSNIDHEKRTYTKDYVPGEITVMFKDDVKRSEKESFVSANGCSIAYTSPYMGFHKVLIPSNRTVEEMVDLFNRCELVKFAEPNGIRHAYWTPNDEYYSYQWHFDAQHINMPAAWDIEQGGNASVVVAVIDTGVQYEDYPIPVYEQGEVTSPDGNYHQAPDLAGPNFTQGYDFIHNDEHPNDQQGHGSHCTGTIAQTTNNSIGVAGMAFNCTIMPIQVLNFEGSGPEQAIADGISYAWQNGADVLSMSLGGDYPSELEHQAIINAVNNGAVVVVAAGNNGTGQVGYPAAFPECISVAATDWDNDLAPYSQYGPGLDISAPGGNTGEDLNNDGYSDGVLQQTFADAFLEPPHNVSLFDYMFFQGTSMACPHVAGLCALLISHGITGVDNIKNAIYETATDVGATGYDEEYGWGIINPAAALNWGGGEVTTLLEEGFESGEAPDWSVYDNDADGNSWEIYSESPDFDLAHSGDYGVGVYYNLNGNDDWLITPQLDLSGYSTINFSFWARSHSPDYLEDFNVKLSTTGNNIVDFTETLDQVSNVPASWQEYSYNLSSYSGGPVYLAVQCVSVDDYYLFADDFLVTASSVAVDEPIAFIPEKFSLSQNYPNPFNSQTTLSFEIIDKKSRVNLSVFNMRGQKVKTLIDNTIMSGRYEVIWDSKNELGVNVSSGIYLYRLEADGISKTGKMILLK